MPITACCVIVTSLVLQSLLCVTLTGIISREDAENQLSGKWVGSFLVRLSDKIWGYVISYRCKDQTQVNTAAVKFKHFLIDAGNAGYRLFGADNFLHESLNDLVAYHSVNWRIFFLWFCLSYRLIVVYCGSGGGWGDWIPAVCSDPHEIT